MTGSGDSVYGPNLYEKLTNNTDPVSTRSVNVKYSGEAVPYGVGWQVVVNAACISTDGREVSDTDRSDVKLYNIN